MSTPPPPYIWQKILKTYPASKNGYILRLLKWESKVVSARDSLLKSSESVTRNQSVLWNKRSFITYSCFYKLYEKGKLISCHLLNYQQTGSTVCPKNKKPYLSNLNLNGNWAFGSFGTSRHQMEIELLKEHGLDTSY